MAFAIKIRSAPGSLICAEYECTQHGRFAIDVPRDDNGDPPAEVRCPFESSIGILMPNGETKTLQCGCDAEWRISSPFGRVQRVTAARRGKDPEPPPGTVDWRSLADGQDVDEWRAIERKKTTAMAHDLARKRFVG